MATSPYHDDQDWKNQTSDYHPSRKKHTKIKKTPLQLAQEAELLSGTTLDEIKDRYLNDDADLSDEWEAFLTN